MQPFYKILLFFFISLFNSSFLFCQDVIIKRNGEEIKAVISEIAPDVVKYKMFERQNGPMYSIARKDVLMITYADGSRDIFAENGEIKTSTGPKTDVKAPETVKKETETEKEQVRTDNSAPKSDNKIKNSNEDIADTKTDLEKRLWRRRFFMSYSGSTGAPLGLMIGAMGGENVGFYAGMRIKSFSPFGGISNYYECDDDGMKGGISSYSYNWTGTELTTRGSFVVGLTRQWGKYVNNYVGLGYGYKKYWHLYNERGSSSTRQIWANHASWDEEGLEYEVGLLWDFGNISLQTGITTINWSVYDWTFGLGFSI